jgi:peptidoglycan hydrolase-like amidase
MNKTVQKEKKKADINRIKVIATSKEQDEREMVTSSKRKNWNKWNITVEETGYWRHGHGHGHGMGIFFYVRNHNSAT